MTGWDGTSEPLGCIDNCSTSSVYGYVKVLCEDLKNSMTLMMSLWSLRMVHSETDKIILSMSIISDKSLGPFWVLLGGEVQY